MAAIEAAPVRAAIMAEPKRLWTYTLDSWCIDVRVAWTLEYKTTPPIRKKYHVVLYIGPFSFYSTG